MIDCDIHPALTGTKDLLPYLDAYWQDQVVMRGINNLELNTYPQKAPLSARDDWRPEGGKAGATLARLRSDALDHFSLDIAICNVLYGSQVLFNVDLAAAFCRATNDWLVEHWLDKEPRLRASIVVPMQDPELAIEEIKRRADDKRFVQVLLLASGDAPLGKRQYWPVYREAEKHGLAIGIHAGQGGRFASTYVGWPSSHLEDYAAQAHTFQGQLLSLLYEGVFLKFPDLKFVFLESGVTWLPSFLSRADNTWRSLRNEVPWIEHPPTEMVRRHLRLSVQPFDAPRDIATVERILALIGADDMLLFASDYPHWQFNGDEIMPHGFSPELIRKITVDNPLATYPRLREVVQ